MGVFVQKCIQIEIPNKLIENMVGEWKQKQPNKTLS